MFPRKFVHNLNIDRAKLTLFFTFDKAESEKCLKLAAAIRDQQKFNVITSELLNVKVDVLVHWPSNLKNQASHVREACQLGQPVIVVRDAKGGVQLPPSKNLAYFEAEISDAKILAEFFVEVVFKLHDDINRGKFRIINQPCYPLREAHQKDQPWTFLEGLEKVVQRPDLAPLELFSDIALEELICALERPSNLSFLTVKCGFKTLIWINCYRWHEKFDRQDFHEEILKNLSQATKRGYDKKTGVSFIEGHVYLLKTRGYLEAPPLLIFYDIGSGQTRDYIKSEICGKFKVPSVVLVDQTSPRPSPRFKASLKGSNELAPILEDADYFRIAGKKSFAHPQEQELTYWLSRVFKENIENVTFVLEGPAFVGKTTLLARTLHNPENSLMLRETCSIRHCLFVHCENSRWKNDLNGLQKRFNALSKSAAEKVLLILDNANDCEAFDSLQRIFGAENVFYCITTRDSTFFKLKSHVFKVKSIEMEYVIEILESDFQCRGMLSRENTEKVAKLTSGEPMLLSFVGPHLRNDVVAAASWVPQVFEVGLDLKSSVRRYLEFVLERSGAWDRFAAFLLIEPWDHMIPLEYISPKNEFVESRLIEASYMHCGLLKLIPKSKHFYEIGLVNSLVFEVAIERLRSQATLFDLSSLRLEAMKLFSGSSVANFFDIFDDEEIGAGYLNLIEDSAFTEEHFTYEKSPRELVMLFLSACKAGKTVIVKNCLDKGISVNVAMSNRLHPGHVFSAVKTNIDIAKLLLEHEKINLGEQDSKGVTALMKAAEKGNSELLKMMVAKCSKEDLNKKDKKGRTALIRAVKKREEECIRLLVDASCDVALTDDRQLNAYSRAICLDIKPEILELLGGDNMLTPECAGAVLLKACKYGNVKLVEDLIQREADVNFAGKKNQTPLMAAVDSKSSLELVQLLLDAGADVNMLDSKARNVLNLACHSDKPSLQLVKLLVANEVKLLAEESEDESSNNFISPFLTACQKSSLEIVEYLMGQLPSWASLRDIEGQTCLHLAIQGSQLEIVRFLLEKDVKLVNVQSTTRKMTPLMKACARRDTEALVELLLEKGAKPNLQDSKGITALMIACRHGSLPAVRLLLERGAANIKVKDERGENALEKAMLDSEEQIALFLEMKGARSDFNANRGKLLLEAARSRNAKLCKTLLDNGVNVNFVVEADDGYSALMHAVSAQREGLVEFLLSRGASRDMKATNGDTSLTLANKVHDNAKLLEMLNEK